jgi:hypothetical protein
MRARTEGQSADPRYRAIPPEALPRAESLAGASTRFGPGLLDDDLDRRIGIVVPNHARIAFATGIRLGR